MLHPAGARLRRVSFWIRSRHVHYFCYPIGVIGVYLSIPDPDFSLSQVSTCTLLIVPPDAAAYCPQAHRVVKGAKRIPRPTKIVFIAIFCIHMKVIRYTCKIILKYVENALVPSAFYKAPFGRLMRKLEPSAPVCCNVNVPPCPLSNSAAIANPRPTPPFLALP